MIGAIARWWGELWRPARKCARLGHARMTVERTGYVRESPIWGNGLAMVLQRRSVCRRCKFNLTGWQTVKRKAVPGKTINDAAWAEIRNAGFTKGNQ